MARPCLNIVGLTLVGALSTLVRPQLYGHTMVCRAALRLALLSRGRQPTGGFCK